MSDEPTAPEALADLVADVREIVDAWGGVGLHATPWRDDGPAWPELDPPPEPPGQPEAPPTPAVERPAPRRSPPSPEKPALFPSQQPRPRAVPPRRPATDGPDRWHGYGQKADPAQAIDKVRRELGDCQRCPLHRTRSTIVFGVGDPSAGLVVVGEAPGYHEDRLGEPFVGPAGEMLTRMLVNVLELRREQVYIMNVLKCRPPDNRDPEPPEVRACRPFFDAQLNVIRPRAILALGRYATQSLLGTTRGIKSLRGHWADYRGIAVMPTFHPAYLLRQPQDKRLALQDLLTLKERLRGER